MPYLAGQSVRLLLAAPHNRVEMCDFVCIWVTCVMGRRVTNVPTSGACPSYVECEDYRSVSLHSIGINMSLLSGVYPRLATYVV